MDAKETTELRLTTELAKYEELYRAMGVKPEDILWVRWNSGGCIAKGIGAEKKLHMNNSEKFKMAMDTFAAKVDRERDARMEQAMKRTERLTRWVMIMTGAVVALTIALVCTSLFQGCSS